MIVRQAGRSLHNGRITSPWLLLLLIALNQDCNQLQVKNLNQQLITVLIEDEEEQQPSSHGLVIRPLCKLLPACLYDNHVQKVSHEQQQVISMQVC
jgi:hypothetical protein